MLFFDSAFVKSLSHEKTDSLEMLMNDNEEYLPEYNLDPKWEESSSAPLKPAFRKASIRMGSVGNKLELLFAMKPEQLDLSVFDFLWRTPK